MCDHWHDDAGFLNHHVGITWQFEQSLQAVDSTTAAHYWDYTIEAADSTEFAKSIIFSEDWFSSASPANARHAVDGGRFAYTAVKSDAREFSAITNPYGLLRSPWNTNSAPFLTRFSKVLGYTYDGYSLATCDDFANVLSETDTLATYLSKLNGELHGPIHIMIGARSASSLHHIRETTRVAHFEPRGAQDGVCRVVTMESSLTRGARSWRRSLQNTLLRVVSHMNIGSTPWEHSRDLEREMDPEECVATNTRNSPCWVAEESRAPSRSRRGLLDLSCREIARDQHVTAFEHT